MSPNLTLPSTVQAVCSSGGGYSGLVLGAVWAVASGPVLGLVPYVNMCG